MVSLIQSLYYDSSSFSESIKFQADEKERAFWKGEVLNNVPYTQTANLFGIISGSSAPGREELGLVWR